jgi:hypothetical protein
MGSQIGRVLVQLLSSGHLQSLIVCSSFALAQPDSVILDKSLEKKWFLGGVQASKVIHGKNYVHSLIKCI